MNINQIFKLTLVLFYIFLASCGYQPMLNETNKKWSLFTNNNIPSIAIAVPVRIRVK